MQPPELDFDEISAEIPEMRALSPGHRKFVWIFAYNGRIATTAALEAGYSKERGYVLLRRQDVVDALYALARRQMYAGAFLAVEVATSILNDPLAAAKDKLKAAVIVLDRSGFGPQAEIYHKHEKVVTADDRLKMAIAISEKTGIPLEKIIGVNRAPQQLEATKVADAEWDF